MAADFAISNGLQLVSTPNVTVVALESGQSGVQTDGSTASAGDYVKPVLPGLSSGTVVFESASPEQNPSPTISPGLAYGPAITGVVPSVSSGTTSVTVVDSLGAVVIGEKIVNESGTTNRAADTATSFPSWLSLNDGELTLQGDASSESFVVKNESVNGIQMLSANRGGERFDVPLASVEKIVFFGGDGNDSFSNFTNVDMEAHGQGGNDRISNNAYGAATIYGGRGSDYLKGGHAADRIFGGAGEDFISGFGGDDFLHGGAGNDRLFGSDGHDILRGGAGHDQLDGGNGNDAIYGGAGNDQLRGQDGADRIDGGPGSDQLWGGKGADRLDGGLGSDILRGGQGRDYLIGNDRELDKLFGGKGKDRFWLNGGPVSE